MKKLIILTGLLLIFSGCGSTADVLISPIVNGAIMWHEGEATKYYQFNSELMYRSTKRALNEMNLTIKSEEKKDKTYNIVAGNKNTLNISIVQVENGISKVQIRVDIMGDKPYAELVYRTIDKQVNTIKFDNFGKPVKQR